MLSPYLTLGRSRGCVPNSSDDVADVSPDPSSATSSMVAVLMASPSVVVKMMCVPSGVNVGWIALLPGPFG